MVIKPVLWELMMTLWHNSQYNQWQMIGTIVISAKHTTGNNKQIIDKQDIVNFFIHQREKHLALALANAYWKQVTPASGIWKVDLICIHTTSLHSRRVEVSSSDSQLRQEPCLWSSQCFINLTQMTAYAFKTLMSTK